jgi:DNA-binding Xre family transcriptional regulator
VSPDQRVGYIRRMVSQSDRDETTQRVAINLAALLEEKMWTKADLRSKVGQAASTAIYDFLSPNARSRSIKVETLAKFAEALDVPIILFFVEPDKRQQFRLMLDSFGTLDADQIAKLLEVARTIFGVTGNPQERS